MEDCYVCECDGVCEWVLDLTDAEYRRLASRGFVMHPRCPRGLPPSAIVLARTERYVLFDVPLDELPSLTLLALFERDHWLGYDPAGAEAARLSGLMSIESWPN